MIGTVFAGPIDFRGLQNVVPSVVRTDPPSSVAMAAIPSGRTGSRAAVPVPLLHASENLPPAGLDTCSRLHKFAEAHGVEPDSILGSHKRKSDPSNVDAPGAKRPCVEGAVLSTSAAGSCAHQQALHADSEAIPAGDISALADQLPGLRSAAMATQCMTQPLHLTQREPVQQPFGPAAQGLTSAWMLAAAMPVQQDPLRNARV